ncbi:MAG TPA: carbohydrate ABC transporter permease [Armatimonadota bacterium]|nr:carbohydrate ABC transporter permease [Armatimonadota bacterium]
MEEGGRTQPLWLRMVAHLGLVVFSAIFCVPFLWLVSRSLMTNDQIMQEPHSLMDLIPAPVRLANYPDALAFKGFHFTTYLTNTLIICALTVFGTILSCSLVAYGLSRIYWRGRNVVFYILLGTMMLPAQVTMIPVFVVFAKLRLVDTFVPLILPAFLGNAFFVFLLRQFFLGIPRDLTDAARLDGCTEFGIWRQVVIPLSKPALATVGLFSFMGAWNDYLGPLIYLSDSSKFTLSLGLASFSSQYGQEPGMLMAATTVMTVPIIVLFFFAQRTFIQGITLTGLKG